MLCPSSSRLISLPTCQPPPHRRFLSFVPVALPVCVASPTASTFAPSLGRTLAVHSPLFSRRGRAKLPSRFVPFLCPLILLVGRHSPPPWLLAAICTSGTWSSSSRCWPLVAHAPRPLGRSQAQRSRELARTEMLPSVCLDRGRSRKQS